MSTLVRLSAIFALLFGVILLVHQQERLLAAEAILNGPPGMISTIDWDAAGAGTGLLLYLFGAGSLATLLVVILRMYRFETVGMSSAALMPLTQALGDLNARAEEQHREREEAVAEMTEIRAVHTAILEGLPSGVLTVDQSGHITTCNPAARAILGWTGESPEGLPVSNLFGGCPPPELDQFYTDDGAAIGAIHPSIQRIDFVWRPAGRNARHLGLSLAPIHIPAGLVTAVLFTDLSQLKRLKRQVELRRHLAQLGEVSAGIAHEFRNNMGAMMGYARLIDHEVEADSPAREMVEALMGELRGMETLIRDLLEFSRKAEPECSPVEVEDMVRQAVRVGAADFGIAVGMRLADDLPAIWVEETLLKQSLINLVRNACEAVTGVEGSPRVTVAVVPPEDGPGATETPEWLIVSVSDNGPGVDKELRAKLFLPFFTTKESGTGMGLAQVNKVVTALGGDLSLEETPGGGATFRMRVPTVAHPTAQKALMAHHV